MADDIDSVNRGAQESKPAHVPHFKSKAEKRVIDHFEIVAFKMLAIAIWSYALVNTFILNLDEKISTVLPNGFMWLIDYKFFAFSAAIIFVVYFMPKGRGLFYFLYFLTFPFVQIGRLFYIIFKKESWSLAIYLINAILGFFRDLKAKLLLAPILAFCIYTSAYAEAEPALVASLILSIALITTICYRAVRQSFRPSDVVKLYGKIFSNFFTPANSAFRIDEKLRGLDVTILTENQLESRNRNLEQAILHNRFCLFLARRLSVYNKSAWRLLPSISGVVSLLFWSTILFAAAYNTLWKLDPQQFALSVPGRFFEFYYFSFNNLVFNSIQQVLPIGDTARFLYMGQVCTLFMVVVVFVATFVSYQNEKHSRDIAETIVELESSARGMEEHIRSEFGLPDIESAMKSVDQIANTILKYFASKLD